MHNTIRVKEIKQAGEWKRSEGCPKQHYVLRDTFETDVNNFLSTLNKT